MRRPVRAGLLLVLLAPLLAPTDLAQDVTILTVDLVVPAVAQQEDGSLVGVASEMHVTLQRPGTGAVYISTEPLTELDMQGSARLAVETAATLVGRSADDADFFFSVRTSSSAIGGPSAGGAMAVAAAALLQGLTLHSDVAMTGTVNPDGSIGPIGGLVQKVDAVASRGVRIFLVPLGQAITTDREGFTSRTVDVSDYALSKYGITVIEVADLYDAIGPFTGVELVRPEATLDPLQQADYRELTARLARNLTEEAQAQLDELEDRFAAARGNVSPADRSAIEGQVAAAGDRLVSAHEAENATRFYLMSSFAFQALVSLGYADALLSYFETDEPSAAAYTERFLAATDARLQASAASALPSYPIPASRIDAQAAAEIRQLEAEARQASARAAYQGADLDTALQDSSFARVRLDTVAWWIAIGREAAAGNVTASVEKDDLDRVADEYADTAELALQYAQLLYGSSVSFASVQATLVRAQAAHDAGRPAARVFELLDAIAATNALLVLAGADSSAAERLVRVSDLAAHEIEVAQAGGAPSVYAASLFELAKSQEVTDPTQAYSDYSYARLAARTGPLLSGQAAAIPDTRPYPQPFDEEVARRFLFVGGMTVALLLLAALSFFLGRTSAAPRPIAKRATPMVPPRPPVRRRRRAGATRTSSHRKR